ncbi:MAG: phosphoadenosine phosphosulfate reductase family protein [Alphaproteobacteria bacterium]
MTWRELATQQARPLDDKITVAHATIADALRVSRHRPAVAFSAGKDSTVLLHMIRQHMPGVLVLYGNTGVEYPECIAFARQLHRDWQLNLHETKPLRTDARSYRYAGQRRIWEHLIKTDQIHSILKLDGKLKSTDALERAAPPELAAQLERDRLTWPAGSVQSYWWCVDQYGWPLLGKAWSRLEARRINIDTFLRFSTSLSRDASLLAYYDVLRHVKISQACCDFLKKQPMLRLQQQYDVDLIFKGLMAAESRSRAKNFLSRGYLFTGHHHNWLPRADPYWHCQPMAIWTDDDVWSYIHRHSLPYSSLYDIGYTDPSGHRVTIKRNGCMGCATDLLFPDNHMSTLRRTHPRAWRVFMERGMAAEIQNLQQARRNGQLTLFDIYSAGELLDIRPCAFDSLDGLTTPDDSDPIMPYDPEEEDVP